jgi:hypothetical protein
MKLNSYTLAVLVLVLLFGGISFSSVMNWWQTESSKVAATYTGGEFAGQANPADIRGSYTFGDVNKNFGVPLADLAAAFRLPAEVDPAAFQVKELESLYEGLTVEVGTASVRMFVAFYKGLPYDLAAAEETYLFPEAKPILEGQNKLLPEQLAFLEAHLVPAAAEGSALVEATPAATQEVNVQFTPAATQAVETQPTLAATEHVQPDKTITGKTTFQNLLDWGVSQEMIEKVLGDTLPAPQTLIKDYATSKGAEFSTLKTTLQAEVDKTK